MATTPAVSRRIETWIEANAGSPYNLREWFDAACSEAALQNKCSLGYVLAILKRQAAEGREDRRQRPGTAPDGASTNGAVNTGAGLIVKTMAQELADMKRAKEAQNA